MKKILLTSVIAVMATFAANASVAPYVSLHGGYDSYKYVLEPDFANHASYDFFANSAYDLSGAIGVKYDITSSLGIRGEIEYDFADARHIGNGAFAMDWLRAHTVLANGYLDFKTAMGLNPYLGAGIGYQWSHHTQGGKRPQIHSLAYQFGGGISYDINKHITLDLGYRYLMSDGVNYDDDGDKFDVRNVFHQFRLGATYTF